ncbi:MAG TPA: hypothetical protein VJX67_18235, partial [Blastocatellia bacterium]|nr:hypothetical protein [Blastocatellia bacterium]
MTSPSASLRQLNGSRGKRRTVWALFLTLFLLILVVTITPLWISYPFRSQTPRGLETAYALHRWAPTITVIALVLILASSVYLWRGAGRWWRRIPLVMVPLIALT